MISKFIANSPELLEENLLTLSEACLNFPVQCSRPTIARWVRQGHRGIVLESVLICGKRYTSQEAIRRYVCKQLQIVAECQESGRGNQSQKTSDGIQE